MASSNPANSSSSVRVCFNVNAPVFSTKKTQMLLPHQSDFWSLIENVSSASKLFRVTSYCLRFLYRLVNKYRSKSLTAAVAPIFARFEFFRPSEDIRGLSITPEELENAKLLWVCHVQGQHFSEEIKQLSTQGVLSSRSTLLRLNPVL